MTRPLTIDRVGGAGNDDQHASKGYIPPRFGVRPRRGNDEDGCGNAVSMESKKRFPQRLGNLPENARFPHSHKPLFFFFLSQQEEKNKEHQERRQQRPAVRSTGRRRVASSATFRTGKNNCRQPAKVVDVDHSEILSQEFAASGANWRVVDALSTGLRLG
jgi:hypothetical protein